MKFRINFRRSPYKYFLLEDNCKVNHFLVKLTFWIYFFLWKDIIRNASYIEIYSMNEASYARYLCGLIMGKLNVKIPIVVLTENDEINGYVYCGGDSFDKGLKGEKLGKRIIDEGTAYLRRGKRPGFAPSL